MRSVPVHQARICPCRLGLKERMVSSMSSRSSTYPSSAPAAGGLVVLALAAVYLIWSSTYLVLRFMVSDLPPMLTSGVRFVLAGALLYAFLRARGAAAPTQKQWLLSCVSGALMFVVGNGFVALAARHVPSGVTAMSVGSMPIFLAAMEASLGRRLPARQWFGLALGFLGVMSMGLADARAQPLAALLLLIAPIGWAAGSLCVRRFDLPAGAMAGATQMLCAGVLMLGFGAALGEQIRAVPPLHALLAFGYLVIFGSIVGFSACLYLLRTTSAPIATSYAYVNPLLAAALGAALAGERMQPELLFAGLLVVAGVATLALGAPRVAASAPAVVLNRT